MRESFARAVVHRLFQEADTPQRLVGSRAASRLLLQRGENVCARPVQGLPGSRKNHPACQ